MCRSLWQTPAALTLISTCVPEGCGVGCIHFFQGGVEIGNLETLHRCSPVVLVLEGGHCHVCPSQTNVDRVFRRSGFDQWMMASGELAGRDRAQFRHFAGALRIGARAAGAKAAARGRRDRRRRLADRHAFGGPHVRIGHRDRLDQQRGIGMRRLANSCSDGPTSQSRPRYITATRSLTALTTARSCAMNSSVNP